MANATRLPSEVLSHILQLSSEGLDSKEQQRARITFGQVSRAFFIASDSASFYIGSEAQAKAFMAKLIREQKWVAHQQGRAPGARTTRAVSLGMRVSTVRKLDVKLSKKKSGGAVLVKLLLACSELITLEVDIGDKLLDVPTTLPALEAALVGLVNLRHLHLSGHEVFASVAIKVLSVVLPSLEILNLKGLDFSRIKVNGALLQNISAPKLRVLHAHIPSSLILRIFGHTTSWAAAFVARLTAEGNLRELHLSNLEHDGVLGLLDDLLPIAPSLERLTWNSSLRGMLDEKAQTAAHKLLAAMTNLRHLEVSMWGIMAPEKAGPTEQEKKAVVTDCTLLVTLATLQNLHTVKLNVIDDDVEAFDDSHVLPFIEALPSLRIIWLVKRARGVSDRSTGWARRGQVLQAVEGGKASVEWL
ncbi:hypothetical protein P7C70_g3990, partial [Phenoliferia sp. Uapishka_3]